MEIEPEAGSQGGFLAVRSIKLFADGALGSRGAAYAAFEEDLKGSIEKVKLADLVVLSRDILKIPPADILKTRIEMTIVGGMIIYEREKPESSSE